MYFFTLNRLYHHLLHWGGNLQQSVGFTDTNKRIEQQISELKRELEQERTISAGLRVNSERERTIINGIAESTRQARMDAQTAVSIGGGAADSLQKIIVQVEIYNSYVRDIERRVDEYFAIQERE